MSLAVELPASSSPNKIVFAGGAATPITGLKAPDKKRLPNCPICQAPFKVKNQKKQRRGAKAEHSCRFV